jgi:type VI protein secretion system component VasK
MGWSVRTVGSLALNFNPKLQDALVAGERIRDIFFKPNGEVQSLSILISPSSSNKNSAKLEVNGQIAELSPSGRSQEIKWPIESNALSAALKINVEGGFSQDISYGGQWGFLKLIQAGKINVVNKNTLNVTWQASVQNMYTVYQQYRLQISGSDNPFADPVFSNFNCPTELLVKEVKPVAAQP